MSKLFTGIKLPHTRTKCEGYPKLHDNKQHHKFQNFIKRNFHQYSIGNIGIVFENDGTKMMNRALVYAWSYPVLTAVI